MTYQPRKLNEAVLMAAAKYYVEEFQKPQTRHPKTGKIVGGRPFVIPDLYKLTYKDVFEFVVARIEDQLPQDELEKFRRDKADVFTPRDDAVFEKLLADKRAINPAGEHIPGKIGTTQLGNRTVARRMQEVPRRKLVERNRNLWHKMTGKHPGYDLVDTGEIRLVPKRDYWPVYAGEIEERLAESGVADPLPEGAEPWSPLPTQVLANNPKIAAVAAIAMNDALVDRFDLGTAAGTIRGRTGAQPADPDASETGTLLFTLTFQSTAFNGSSDSGSSGIATAATITSDTSADTTGTLTYCRAGSVGGGGADDVMDGSAGTSGCDYNFNTTSIVAGAAVTVSSMTVATPQG